VVQNLKAMYANVYVENQYLHFAIRSGGVWKGYRGTRGRGDVPESFVYIFPKELRPFRVSFSRYQ